MKKFNLSSYKPCVPKYVELVFDRILGNQLSLYVLVGIMIHSKREPRDTAINSSLMAAGALLISSWQEADFFTTLAVAISISLSLSQTRTQKAQYITDFRDSFTFMDKCGSERIVYI